MSATDRSLFDDFNNNIMALEAAFNPPATSASNAATLAANPQIKNISSIAKKAIPKLREDMRQTLPLLEKEDKLKGAKLIEEMNKSLVGGKIAEAKEKLADLRKLVEKTFPKLVEQDKLKEKAQYELPTGYGVADAGTMMDPTHIIHREGDKKTTEDDKPDAFSDYHGGAETAATLNIEQATKIIKNYIAELPKDEYEENLTNLTYTLHDIGNTRGVDYSDIITALRKKSGKAEEEANKDILAAAESTPSYGALNRIFHPTLVEKGFVTDEAHNEALVASIEYEITNGILNQEIFKALLEVFPLTEKIKARLFQAAQSTPNSQMVATVLYPEKALRPASAIIEEQMRTHIGNKKNYEEAQKALIVGLKSHADMSQVSLKALVDLLIKDNPSIKADEKSVKLPVFEAVRGTPYEKVIDSLLWPNGVGKPREIVLEETLKKEVVGSRLDGALKELVTGLKKLQEGVDYVMQQLDGGSEKQKTFKIIPKEMLMRLINIIAQNEGLKRTYNDLGQRIYKAIDNDGSLKDSGISNEASKILWPAGKPADLALVERLTKSDTTTALIFFKSSLNEVMTLSDAELLKLMEIIINKPGDKEKTKSKLFDVFISTPGKDRVLQLLYKGDPLQLASDIYKKRTDYTNFQTIYEHFLSRMTNMSMAEKKKAIWDKNKSESAYFLISLREFLWSRTPPPGIEKGTKLEKPTSAPSIASTAADNRDVKK